MSEEIIKVLDNLGERFGIAIDWTSENVIPYLQDLFTRFINYKIGISIMLIVACLIFLISFAIILVKCAKGFEEECNREHYCDTNEFRQCYCGVGFFISIVICIIAPIELLKNTDDLIKELTIPEVIVYEYVQTQIEF